MKSIEDKLILKNFFYAHVYTAVEMQNWTLKSARRTWSILVFFGRFLEEICDVHRLSEVRPSHILQYEALLRAIPTNYHAAYGEHPRSIRSMVSEGVRAKGLAAATRAHHLQVLRGFFDSPMNQLFNANFKQMKWSLAFVEQARMGILPSDIRSRANE